MRILLTGSSGFVGTHLLRYLSTAGYDTSRLVRSKDHRGPKCSYWNPAKGELESELVEGYDVVIHLSGENIASGRWTSKRKRQIKNSRLDSTLLLSRKLATAQTKPKILIAASAIGYYGNRGDEILDEDSPNGIGFFAELCREWELATSVATKAGIRVVNLRLGMVLSNDGGGLAKMLPAFRFGLGGTMGSGDQYMSWVSIDDVLEIIGFIILNDTIIGPLNCVAPSPVTNREFTKTLGKLLNRPAILSLPLPFLKLLLGDLAEEITASIRVKPKKLSDNGYLFKDSDLENCLEKLLAVNP